MKFYDLLIFSTIKCSVHLVALNFEGYNGIQQKALKGCCPILLEPCLGSFSKVFLFFEYLIESYHDPLLMG